LLHHGTSRASSFAVGPLIADGVLHSLERRAKFSAERRERVKGERVERHWSAPHFECLGSRTQTRPRHRQEAGGSVLELNNNNIFAVTPENADLLVHTRMYRQRDDRAWPDLSPTGRLLIDVSVGSNTASSTHA
jgi:hypothetical protein